MDAENFTLGKIFHQPRSIFIQISNREKWDNIQCELFTSEMANQKEKLDKFVRLKNL